MKKKAIILIITVTGLFIITFSFAQQSIQVKPSPQQSPTEKGIIEKSVSPQMVRKVPAIDANMLKKLQAFPSRATLINTLMGNQATRTVLESSARKAKRQVNELSSKGLDGKVVSAAPEGQKIDQLNWNAGIKFSLIKNRPNFFDLTTNSTASLGEVIGWGVILNSNSMSIDFNNDVFVLMSGGYACLSLCLPPSASTYMIAIHVAGFTQVVDLIKAIIQDSSGSKTLDMIPLTGRDGFVGMTIVSPKDFKQAVRSCIIMVNLPEQAVFAGFTITRL